MEKHYLKAELEQAVREDPGIVDFIEAASLDGMWYWDLHNQEHEWMSPTFWTTLGYDPAEKKHLVSEWTDLIFEEDFKKIQQNLEEHFNDPNVPFSQTVRYKHKDGSTVWIRCRGMAVRDETGRPKRMLGAHVDITDLIKSRETLKMLSNEYEKVFNGTQDALFLIEILGQGKFRFIRNNRSHQEQTGISLEQIAGKTPQELLGTEGGEIVSANYQRAVDAGEMIRYEEELTLSGMTKIWETTMTPYMDADPPYLVGSAMDITERKKLKDQLEWMANYDDLTELPNRRKMMQQLEDAVETSAQANQSFALFFLDLDGFKEVNDAFGHKTGDKLLKLVAERLTASLRKEDFVARIGGDEFTGIMYDVICDDDLFVRMENIKNQIGEPASIAGKTVDIRASIGTVIFPNDGSDPEELLNKADKAMYKNKHGK
ncbi:sensor domain-containing diguanylate cyclase [Salisediminibacterium selenitireducens]|uniref:Diguanylate cyclase with PAS/PAC sensor n=1 Tax=Bacillus selenitireducens (strain ATCC 700615 / DSM 15326 / MLS10) TaxID=439292 RepID=D6Y048_BACIE|nr:sensor domain-containing diguanylate cyclase [Salisediminibacterium selenitireducens]ADH98439.1 diguanylate cyclase with PAS/PAC sensor [[Bacillus] selenitireducens MLS10]